MKVQTEAEIIGQLMEFAVKTKYNDIPPEVVDFAKGITLKTVAGMLVGPGKPSCRKMVRIIRDRRLPEDVGVIGCGFKTSLWEAAYLHAFFAHAAELEDNRIVEEGGASWDITVIPLVFSLVEKLRMSGKSLLEALIVGMEVHARTCVFNSEHLGLTFIPGAVGPAVAAAKAYDLGVKEMTNALALATPSIPLSHMNFATDAHYYESALSSFNGIMAAEMAKEGMAGNPNMITYLSKLLGKDKVNPEKIVKDLGKKWLMTQIWIKKYPCCFLMHRPLDATIELMRDKNLSYGDVQTIEVEVSPIDEVCNRPNPKSEMDLQFSFQNVLGAAMLYGDVNFAHVADDAVDDPKLKEARLKVKVNVHPDWPDQLDRAMTIPAAHITITTRDGRRFSKERKYMIGSPQEPLTLEQIKGLYAKFTAGVLSEEQSRKTGEAIANLEKFNDLAELMDILVYRHRI